ncbi:MAG: GNAT family N-acetyltransferase [Lachnospiraceae bacterium]|nr:GNAT family N-acetyltransferase [Lachnospiraceae bacterium]
MIRLAKKKDIPKLLILLQEVLEIHAAIRPDIFISGTTKYTEEELELLLEDENRPIYVAVDDQDEVLGYAFCVIKSQPFSNNMIQFKSLFIDDLCVDSRCRGMGIGEKLFHYLEGEAKKLGCYEITLNVWSGNDGAERFYEKLGMKTKERQMEFILD